MIRQSKILEIPEILNITSACANTMASQGIFQWNAHYPNRETFLKDLERKELFVLEEGAVIIGVIVVSGHKDREYESVSWITPDGNNCYIHRLAVHPEFQGRGYARQLMDFAETMAREKGAVSVRLDTFSLNTRNQRFYEQRGYIRLDDIYFPNQSSHPFHCYEMIL
jgi:ribosomal protein S18 acetylase RimI-like enzyme